MADNEKKQCRNTEQYMDASQFARLCNSESLDGGPLCLPPTLKLLRCGPEQPMLAACFEALGELHPV